MNNQAKLEVCAFHIDSCIIAEREGAYRAELCDNPIEGGTTPSYGTIKRVREKVAIKLYPIIRPRSGNYFYTEEEFEILKQDVLICRELGCDGISVGVQLMDATIDKERFKRIVEWAGPMGVTCNRVFDCAPDPYKALEDIIECGCERVLTSGLKTAAPDAAELLGELVRVAGSRISIMPGAGVKSVNLAKLKATCGASEYHSSARVMAPNPVTYVNPEVNDYGNVYIADAGEVRAMVNILQA
ncbi:MAG: copper homeostasis protein CutC [Sphingobacteriia bacterium]|nr:copper homeostasis protein CutC [Sphingobacteriia bacterium]